MQLTSTASQNKNYLVYALSTKNSTITVLNKTVKMYLFYLTNEGVMQKSNIIKIILDYQSFNFANKISVIQAAAEDIANKYEQVLQLTELNLKMYKEIEDTLKEVNK